MFDNWQNKIKEGSIPREEIEILFENIKHGAELANLYGDVFKDYCKKKDIALNDIPRCKSLFLLSISSLYCIFGKMDEEFLDPESMQLFSMLTRQLYKYLFESENYNSSKEPS